MSVPDVLNQPWAIERSKFDMICGVYERHLGGERLDAEGLRAAIGSDPRKAAAPGYTVDNGVAVIPVEGVLAKKLNLLTAISGGMSTQMLVDTVNEAMADDSVHSLMLAIDSPGGEVDGTQQIGDAVAAATKPTAAWIDGQGCSAAYWIAAQCNAIYAASDTTQIGSMGVLIQHVNYSKADEVKGKVTTHIVTGKYKVAASSAKPLSQDDREYLQSKADYIYQIFLGAVAEGRGMDPKAVDDIAGEAQVFFAQQAVDNGLIDGIASQDDVISKLAAAHQQRLQSAGAPTPARTSHAAYIPSGESAMSYKTFATEADYRAEIAAAEARGVASTIAPEVVLRQRGQENAKKMTRYMEEQKAKGRNITLVVALQELMDLGQIAE